MRNIIIELKDKIEERKKMIKSGQSNEYNQYDKGFIHAYEEAITLMEKETTNETSK